VFDDSGAFNPTYDEKTSTRMEARTVILAVGQTAELGYLAEEALIRRKGGRIEVDESTLATGEKGIFAGGDVASGPGTIIHAIAHGRKSASSIDRFLGGDGNIEETLARPEKQVSLRPFNPEVKPRSPVPLLKAPKRVAGFQQVEQGLTEEQVAGEADRCLQCDARRFEVVLNTESCKECGYCAEVCAVGTFGPSEIYNAKGYRPQEVKTSDWCVGCFKCYFACPDFAVDVREVGA
jgi:NAD-dependent dihydropyrimidine dehydrogenase PreA subunit